MNILILSGGGSHGSFQLGVLKRLVEMGKSWDVIAGVSVGALNGTYLAMYNKEEVAKGIEQLESIWLSIRGNQDIIKPWFPFPLNYLSAYFKGSLNTTQPLMNLILSKFNNELLQASNVDLRIGVVGLGCGHFKTIPKATENFIQWVLASASIPLIMPPVELEGDKWIDGGVRNQTPLVCVVDLVKLAVSRGERVEIDVVMTGPTENDVLKEDPKKIHSFLHIALRTAQIALDEIYLTELEKLEQAHSVTVYEPKAPLPVDSMNFHPGMIRMMIRLGYEETRI